MLVLNPLFLQGAVYSANGRWGQDGALNPISARSLLRWKRAGVVMGVVNSISADLTAAGVAREFKYGEGLSVRAEIKIENVYPAVLRYVSSHLNGFCVLLLQSHPASLTALPRPLREREMKRKVHGQ